MHKAPGSISAPQNKNKYTHKKEGWEGNITYVSSLFGPCYSIARETSESPFVRIGKPNLSQGKIFSLGHTVDKKLGLSKVAHTCNPSYLRQRLGGLCSRPACAKVSEILSQNKPGVVADACGASYLGGRSRRITVQGQPAQNQKTLSEKEEQSTRLASVRPLVQSPVLFSPHQRKGELVPRPAERPHSWMDLLQKACAIPS
jgi:hypothetical protein